MKKEELEANEATRLHVSRVRALLHNFIIALLERAETHDNSKFKSPEVEVFAEYTPKLRDSTYGSEEYKGFLKEMGVALEHHYAVNSHHPEHHEEGVNGMDLVDVVEMFCDWKAASERHANGDIRESIKHNTGRFNLSDQLVSVLTNSVPLVEDGKLPE